MLVGKFHPLIMRNLSAVFLAATILFISNSAVAQNPVDSIKVNGTTSIIDGEMHYHLKNGQTLIYPKPRSFGFIRNLPGDAGGIVSSAFNKKSLKPWAVIAATTGLLLLVDQPMLDGVREFSDNIGLQGHEKNYNVIIRPGGKEIALLRLPGNLNTAFYQLGQGFPSLVIGAGLYAYGKIHHDYRALSTASQLAESFILMGVGTQIVKRISGRESPSNATVTAGKWSPFPSFSQYQNNTPQYDAFPSGHIATMMSSITIFAQNYPEKRWIRPVGYSLMALVGYSMLNNEVHWASDYPLAIGMGFLCAKQVAKRNRRVVNKTSASQKKKGEFDFTLNYLAGTVAPGFTYRF